ncbi:hypothetical protein O0466_000445 [Salmonella enterica]|nr:hypothetical protein [Salmonella enterica]HCM1893432.1 hypothetical protein [Salmonella enterica subsp. diarizonae serovar 57:c:e,n,x,z15]EAX3524702.1 hypothetical protein [Salmonella enterica]EAY1317956.1 hypothetical protein [Salmonella enterica]EGQ5164903.1 hypothetical protein [Salmonella enterica]
MIIDEFLYALGFKTDTSGAKSFVSALGGVDQASQHTTKSMLHAVTAGTLLAHGLEKASELLGELGHSFLENSEHMENARVTMEALYTTAAEGDQKFKWLWDFAQKNPVMGMDAATEVFMALKNNGIDPTTQALKAFGDAAAAVPSVAKYIPQGIAELIEGRYHAGGVLSPLMNLHGAGKNRVYDGSYVNKAGQKISVQLDFNNAQKATDQLIQILNDKFGGSMDAHAKTWFGLTQRMKTDWMVFTQVIMNNGVFDSLKEALAKVLEQWEAFTKTDRFRRMMDNVSTIGVEAVTALSAVGDAIGYIINLIAEFTSGPGAEIVASGFFALLLDGSIIKAIKGVVTGIKAICEAESIMDLLAQANPLMWIVDGVALLAIGIGVLIKKWQEFKLGMLDTGWLHDTFLYISNFVAGLSADIKYMLESVEWAWLKAKDITHTATDEDEKRMDDISERHDKTTMLQAESDAMNKNTEKDSVNTAYTKALRDEKTAHPNLSGSFLIEAVKKDHLDVFTAAMKNGLIKYKSPQQMKDDRRKENGDTDNSNTITTINNHPTVYVSLPEVKTKEQLNEWLNADNSDIPGVDVVTATLNNSNGGRKL